MIISDLEFYQVRIECDQVEGPIQRLLVRLATYSGREGWGEAEQVQWRGSEIDQRRDHLLPALTGRSVFDIEELIRFDQFGSNALCAAVEMACWDLIGHITGQPIYRLLGGEYRRRVPAIVPIQGQSPRECAAMARELLSQGYTRHLVTLEGDAARDAKLVMAIRQATGDRAELRIDGRCHYNLDTARDFCLEVEELGISCLLDPIRNDLPGMGRSAKSTRSYRDLIETLQRQTGIPLGLCRSISAPRDILDCVQRGTGAQITVDPEAVGGICQSRKCAAIAEAAELPLALGNKASLGIAAAAMLHTAACCPAYSLGNFSAGHFLCDDILVEPLEMADGLMTVPQGPGLGIEIDRAKVERYATSLLDPTDSE